MRWLGHAHRRQESLPRSLADKVAPITGTASITEVAEKIAAVVKASPTRTARRSRSKRQTGAVPPIGGGTTPRRRDGAPTSGFRTQVRMSVEG